MYFTLILDILNWKCDKIKIDFLEISTLDEMKSKIFNLRQKFIDNIGPWLVFNLQNRIDKDIFFYYRAYVIWKVFDEILWDDELLNNILSNRFSKIEN